MPEFGSKHKRKNMGFTLTEIIAVVAIISVLLAVAIPGVIEYRRQLRLVELDDCARTIFLAAQNRLTAMVSAGEKLEAVGDGRTTVTDGAATYDLMHVRTGGTNLSFIVIPGSVDPELANGSCAVEYNAETGAVFAVWYWEDDSGFTYADGFNYDTADTTRDARVSQMVGYYGGSVVERTEVGQMPLPRVKLINAEELRLEITVPTDSGAGPSDDTIYLSVTINGRALFTDVNTYSGTTGTVVLDTLKPGEYTDIPTPAGGLGWTCGNSFAGWGTGLAPGEDFTARITLYSTEGGYLPQTFSVTANSLFAGRTGDTVSVAYGRHLQNLSVEEAYTAAVQTDNIAFVKVDGVDGVYSWYDTYGDRAFEPVVNILLTSYDGGGHGIRGLNAQSAGEAGLFARAKGEIRDLTLIDATVKGGTDVGALAGQAAYDLQITGCGVYLTHADRSVYRLTGDTVGGLVGRADGHTLTVTGSFASTVENGGTVGGIVGAGSKVNIAGSYAAGYLKGDTVGGLVGDADDLTVSNSYAAGIIETPETGVGAGLAPTAVTVDDKAGLAATYAAPRYIKADGQTVYGTFPDAGDTVKYAAQGDIAYEDDSGDGGLVVPDVMPTDKNAVPYRMLDETGSLTDIYPYGLVLTPHYGDWLQADDEGSAVMYCERYEDGSWGFYHARYNEDGELEAVNSLRDEQVVEDCYRLRSRADLTALGYVEDTDITLTSGYKAYKLPAATVDGQYRRLDITIPDEGERTFIYCPDFACEAFDVTAQREKTVASGGTWTVPASLELMAKPGLTDTGISAVIIRTPRHLANMAALTNVSGSGAAGWKYVQLLDVDYSVYETYEDADFTTGSETDPQISAALSTGGNYNGNDNAVKNLYLKPAAGGDCGLFGTVTGGAVLQNMRLVNISSHAASGNAGALAGSINGATVRSCGVYCEKTAGTATVGEAYAKFTVISDSGRAGGLAGRITSGTQITGCYASVKVDGGTCAGGFAGTIDGAATNVYNCYSGGHTQGGVYLADGVNVTVTGSGPVGGFVGENKSGLFGGTVYTTCSVGSAGGAEKRGLFAGDGEATAVNPSAVIYATGEAFENDTSGWAQSDARAEDGVAVGAALPAGGLDDGHTYSYDETYDGSGYPYATGLTEHHGDWAEKDVAGIFYWEIEDGVYHFSTLTWDGGSASVVEDLCVTHACGGVIDAWGYGVFGVDDMSAMTGVKTDGRAEAATALSEFLADHSTVEKAFVVTGDGSDIARMTALGDTLIFDTRFAAAMELEKNAGAMPRRIRTVDQLQSIKGNAGFTYGQTHDIYADGEAISGLALTGASDGYDGGFYRILELDITGNDRALFDSVTGTGVHGVILYAPCGDGVISGKNAAGIVSRLENGAVDSCIVSGYNVSGSGSVGGLVAVASGTSTVSGCEVTAAFDTGTVTGVTVGGLVGSATGTLTVERSYAGGSIKTGRAVSSVGGLVGSGTGVTYDTVYSYMDMTEVDRNTAGIYGIGPGKASGSSLMCEYWYAGLPAVSGTDTSVPVDTKDDASVSGVTLAQLKNDGQRLDGYSVEECYKPDTDREQGLKNLVGYADTTDVRKYAVFPFAAFVTDDTQGAYSMRNLHYGDFPSAAYAGIFYYEKENITRKTPTGTVTDTVYNFYACGGEIYRGAMRGRRLLDGLCYDHHLNGERASIVETGYGYFYPTDDGIKYDFSRVRDRKQVTDGVNTLLDSTDTVRLELLKALDVSGSYAVYTQTAENGYKTETWTLNTDIKDTQVQMYVNPSYGGCISFNDGVGESADEQVGLRTAAQLGSIVGKEDDSIEYCAVTHDIDLKGVDWTPGKLYVTALDGGSYRIFDLKVELSSGAAGLFESTRANTTIKNVILYSPDGSGRITTGSGNAGGIFATTSGSNVTIDNCVVSGYTISGSKYVGGITGDSGKDAIITRCQTDVVLTSADDCAGGIAGYMRGTIEHCVAGGEIYHVDSGAGVGGILGGTSTDAVTVRSSYSYMDLIESGANTVYAIANDSRNNVTVTDCSYLAAMLPSWAVEEDQGEPFTVETYPPLTAPVSGGASAADYTWVPNDEDPYDGLTYKTVADDKYNHMTFTTVALDPLFDRGVDAKGNHYVHYGAWAGAPRAVGAMYWTIDEDGEFAYHLMGLYLTGGRANIRGGHMHRAPRGRQRRHPGAPHRVHGLRPCQHGQCGLPGYQGAFRRSGLAGDHRRRE